LDLTGDEIAKVSQASDAPVSPIFKTRLIKNDGENVGFGPLAKGI
jgi:hypothetical protein